MYYRLLQFEKKYTCSNGEINTIETSHEYRFRGADELANFIKKMALYSEDDIHIDISKEDTEE